MPSPAELKRIQADLAAAELTRDELSYELAKATMTANVGKRSAQAIEADFIAAEADLAEIEERRAALLGAPANDVAPAAVAALPSPAESQAEFVDTKQAAALLSVSVKTLEALRARGKGPPFKYVGRRVRYRRDDLLKP